MSLSELIYSEVGFDHEAAEQRLSHYLSRDNFRLAYHLTEQGFSVLPLCPDSKRPAVAWKPLQYRLATAQQLVDWFGENDFWPAIVTGEISGITVIDCDSPEAVAAAALAGCFSELGQSTSRGEHFVFRFSDERNTVRVCGMEGVDRRGEGGYVKAYEDAFTWTRDAVRKAPYLPEQFR